MIPHGFGSNLNLFLRTTYKNRLSKPFFRNGFPASFPKRHGSSGKCEGMVCFGSVELRVVVGSLQSNLNCESSCRAIPIP